MFEGNDVIYASKKEQYTVFFLVFVGVLSLTYGFFFLVGFLPEKPTDSQVVPSPAESLENDIPLEESGTSEENIDEIVIDPFPQRIIFDSLDNRVVSIHNPQTASIEVLDDALLSGAVRHPDSADFERVGTIFLFGHSSYLPNVINKNFQAFNGIQKLTWGDTVRLQSSDREYVYRVDKVYEAKADDAEVLIESGIGRLTLVTCDSFGSKSDRFVVEATLIENRAIEVGVSET